MRQTLQLIARFPLLSVYSYHAHKYYTDNKSLIIHNPDAKLSTAQNILSMLRPDRGFTPLEARVLDLCLVLHAEHGGGNNSTFTMHVVTSGGTDTYSAVAAALGSLKGYRHGGANIKVHYMFEDMKSSLKTINDGTVSDYLMQLLDKQAFDRSGLIYGMGHAIYSLSDPRAEILKKYVKELAQEKDLEDEYMLYEKVERLAPEIISSRRKMYKGVSANIDFYSGLLYSMLGIPSELFTPLFAIARITGWGAHRIEEISNNGKIIRPGYIAVAPRMNYVPLSQRKSE
jgi:citrate synthase